MGLIKVIMSGFIILLATTAYEPVNPTLYDNYVEGALVVYSQLKEPSVEESEQFYSFIQTEWSSCWNHCSINGQLAAKKYVAIRKLELING